MNKPLLLGSIDVESWICSDLFSAGRTPAEEVCTIEAPLRWILETLKQYNVKMTFFCLGIYAEIKPDLIKLIIRDGHEIASHGYSHIALTGTSKEQALYEMTESKKILENITDYEVIGFRAASAKSGSNLKLIENAGYRYDSSLVHALPIPGWYGDLSVPSIPFKLSEHKNFQSVDDRILEFPISSNPFIKLPMSAWWIRNMGRSYFLNSVKQSLKYYNYCAFYLHPWEFSNYFPIKKSAPFHVYRNIGGYMKNTFVKFLKRWSSEAVIAPYKNVYDRLKEQAGA